MVTLVPPEREDPRAHLGQQVKPASLDRQGPQGRLDNQEALEYREPREHQGPGGQTERQGTPVPQVWQAQMEPQVRLEPRVMLEVLVVREIEATRDRLDFREFKGQMGLLDPMGRQEV